MLSVAVPAYWLYGEGRSDRFPEALHLETIFSRSSLHNWRIRPHWHQDMHQFFLIVAGGGTARIDGQDHGLAPGTAILMPPLAVHEFSFEPGTDGFVASVAEVTLQRLFEAEPATAAALVQPMVLARQSEDDPEFAELEADMRAALAEFGKNRGSREMALSAHASLIAIWFSRAAGRRAAMIDMSKDARTVLVLRFIERVEADFRTHKPLAEYADALNVSVPHLTRTCRELLGCSAIRVIHDRLMLEARRQLVYTSMPISQVAFSLGFSDPAYFSRFFAGRAGMAPSDYRGVAEPLPET